MDTLPFKLGELFTKNNNNQLFAFLKYYADVLKQLDKYRIGSINSKKAAMGSVMLTKICSKLNP
jgi:hypothetical protein